MEVHECSSALAAAEIVAVLSGKPGPELPIWAQETIDKHNQLQVQSLVPLALQAIEHVRRDSECQELWDESEYADEWYGVLDNLEARLRA